MVALENLQMLVFLHDLSVARAASDSRRWSRFAEVQMDEPITESCTAYDESHMAPVTAVP